MENKLFLINETQAAAFLGCEVSTLLQYDRYKYHCPSIKENGVRFFNEDDLIRFKEKRDSSATKLPKEPVVNKQVINQEIQYKWDVFLLTKFFTMPQARIYDLLHKFSEKHNLQIDFNDCPFLRSPFTGNSFVRGNVDVYEFVATRLNKLFVLILNKDVSDVFDIAKALKNSSMDCKIPKQSMTADIKKQAKKEQQNMDAKITIGRMFRENYNRAFAKPGLKVKRLR